MQGWEPAILHTTEPWAIIDDLQPGTTYRMLVRAHNVYGTSEPSAVSNRIMTTGPPSTSHGWSDEQIQNNLNDIRVNITSLSVLTSTALNTTWMVRFSSKYKIFLKPEKAGL